MTIEESVFLVGVVIGTIGGVVYCLTQKVGWGDKLNWITHAVYGALAGFFVSLFNVTIVIEHYDPDLPLTSIFIVVAPLAFSAGYFGIDFIRALINKYYPKPGGQN